MFKRVNSDVVPFSINSPAGNRYAFGTTDVSNDIDVNYNENIKKGFGTGPNEFPELEDFNALMFTGSYLAAYLYQAGIPEWNDKQKYYINSIAMGSDGNLYKSLTGTEETPNVDNNPTLAGSVSWKSILSDYALINGDETKRFKVADAVELNEAINKKQFDDTVVKLTGNQIIDGEKTFISPITGGFSGTTYFSNSTGNEYNNSNIYINGNGIEDTIKPSIGFHQPDLYAGTLSMVDVSTFQFKRQEGIPAILANSITGNSDTATKLQTARTINGVAFDGSANITIPTGFTDGLLENGWVKLPNNLIMQWGISVSNVINVSFPISFPTMCLNAQVSFYAASDMGSISTGHLTIYDKTKNGLTYTTASVVPRIWFAIGY